MMESFNEEKSAALASEQNHYEDSKENCSKEEIRRDVFSTADEARERAEEIGCEGIHSHSEDGQEIFMPCSTHDEYVEATGEDVKADS